MKRLTALTKQTEDYGINTQKELDLIQQIDKRLNKDNSGFYKDNIFYGVNGGIFYEIENNKIRLYIVESFIFKDIDKKSEQQNNAVAYVATRLDNNGKANESYQYVEIKENATAMDAIVSHITINSMGLIRINEIYDFESIKEFLKQNFKDYVLE